MRHGQNLTKDGKGKIRIRQGKGKAVSHLGSWGSAGHMQKKVKYKGTMRWDILQDIIDKHGYKSYLEIGIDKARNWNNIKCNLKHGVDPANNRGTHQMTSDEFFNRFKDTYDLVFIDGLHYAEQVEKDIDNALKHLNPGGTVVMHDCNPITEEQQIVPKNGQRIWTGDCWKAFVKNRTRSDLEMYVVNTNNGIGIIRPGKQEPITIEGSLDYNNFEANRENWLNLMSVTSFREKIA